MNIKRSLLVYVVYLIVMKFIKLILMIRIFEYSFSFLISRFEMNFFKSTLKFFLIKGI